MVPLLAGGRSRGVGSRTGSTFSGIPTGLHRMAMSAAAGVLSLHCLAAPVALAGETATTRISVLSPGTVGVTERRADWTLRSQTAAARAPEASDRSVGHRYTGHADVSMFPWRELLFYGMLAAIVVGGLLAATGGSRQSSRHS
mgnify:CR=1 FL=1